MKKAALAHIPIFLGLVLVLLFSISTYAEVTEEEVNSLLSPAPAEFDQEYWAKGLMAYLSSCKGGECSCIFGITQEKEVDTGIFWFGNFARGSADEMYREYGRLNTGKGGYAGPFSKKLGKCHAAKQFVTQDGNGQCCMQFNSGKQCIPCSSFQSYASGLGIQENQTSKHLWYGATLSGSVYLHDNTHCAGPRCKLSVACPTVTAAAMKDLCKNYIGQYPKRTAIPHSWDDNIVEEEHAGGVWYYFNGNATGNMESARTGLQNIKDKCGSFQFSRLGGTGGTTVASNSTTSSPSSTSTSTSDSTSDSSDDSFRSRLGSSGSSSSSGGSGASVGDFLSTFIDDLIASNAQAQQESAESESDEEESTSTAVVSRSELNNNCSLINGVKLCDNE